MIIHVEIEVAVEVSGNLDTETGEFTPEVAVLSSFEGDRQFCLYSEDLVDMHPEDDGQDGRSPFETDDGWMSDDQVRDLWGYEVLAKADSFVAARLYKAGA